MPDDPDSWGDKEDWYEPILGKNARPDISSKNDQKRGDDQIDPAYNDALRILGREDQIVADYVQYEPTMDDREAAQLARALTALRRAASRNPQIRQQVEYFIRELQNHPSNRRELRKYYENIRQGDTKIRYALDEVYKTLK